MSTSTTHEDDESLTAPVSPKQLKTFLVHAPVMYKRQLHRGAERLILTNCYRTLWGNNKEYMQKYFFHDSTDDLSALLEKYNLFGRGDERSVVLPSNPDNVIVDPSGDEPEYWESQRGKQCGHLFKKGESVYRCRNCGLDDTCVLCSKCFHATNHDGHDVKIWISRGAGGCCDCGDPEAWKVPLECSIHSLSAASNNTDAATPEHKSEVPAELMRQMKETIEVVMDYILETFAASPEDVSPGTKEEIQRDCRDTARALGTPNHDKATTYSCVLWNDEKHSFNEVIDIVMRAAQVTATQASKIAESVDAHGRHVVDNSADLDRILRMAERIRSIKLAVTVRSTVDTVREEICGLLLDWLKELISGKYKFFNNVEGGNCILRDIICEVLCQEYSLPAGLAALSTKSRRGPMEEADVDGDIDEDILDMDDDNDDQEDVEDGEGELFETHMLVEDQDFFVELFGNTNEAWLAEETEEDEEGEEEGMEQQEEEDNDGSGGSHYEDAGSDIEMISAIEPEQNMEPLPRRRIRRGSSSPQPSSSSANSTAAKSQPSEQSQRRHSAHRIHDIADLRWDLGGWLSCTDKLELEERNFAKELGVPLLTNKMLADGNKKIRREFSRKLRCDYLLHYDLRLWKTARASIKDLLIGTLVSNFEYRPIIGTRFARNYPELVDAFFLKDREPEHSISTISVQLLTVPTVAAMLVKEYKFFAMTCSILANFFLTDKIQLLLPEEYHRMQVDCGGRAIRRHRFAYTFFDLRYVLNAEPVKVEVCQNPVYLRHFLDMLYQFQAMDPLVRSAEVHVEYESNTWVNAFNVTLQISKLCRLYADCFASLQTIMPAAEASRNLCCTICRVLKTLAEWSPHLPEQHNDRPLIKGTMDQQFKTIEMPHAGSFSVIQYHVASNPVSFHHPYHWLLSELLEHVTLLTDELLADLNITGGFKGLVQQINSQFDHDIIMSILEYPLRVRVLLAQISCGVWVRNGFGIRNQARTYRDISVRENTYDRDLYLLQTGFVIAEPNHLLTTMLDRFDIMEYFTGKPDKRHPHYDSSQLICIVEEFLDFLIICVTERAYASHMSIEDKIRRAIIQYLGLSSMAYSELIKVIPDSLSEHESFETLLGTLANYKAPGGLNDHGRYELKEEFYAEIDPYYWHFTRNQREEAFEKLQKRQSKQSSDKEFFIIPNLRKIESGPFKYLGNCLQTRVMCQIILHALWNTRIAKSVKSESILDDALYLAIVAVTDENNEVSEWRRQLSKGKFKQGTSAPVDGGFVQHAVEDKYAVMVNEFEREHVTLLTVILRFLGDREYANVHKRCTFIVDKIYELGSEEAKRIINEWRALHQEAASTEGGKGVADREAEYERRKAAAKARQAGIMAEFAKAQSQFMSQHADLYDEDEDDNLDEELEQEAVFADTGSDTDVERMFHFPSGTCIVCQEELDRSRTYGMLALIQKSKVARTTPMQDSGAMLDVLETAEHVDTWARHLEPSKDKETLLRGFPANVNPPHRHISTCGHMMHAHCFREYQTHVDNEDMRLRTPLFPGQSNSKKFLCPLCKAFGNVLLPIEWKSKKESFPGPVATHTEYDLLGEAAKEAISKLDGIEWPGEAIPGSMEIESEALAGEVTDVDTLRVLYNLIKRALQNGERTRFDSANREKQCELRKAIVQLFDMYAYTISAIEIAQRGDHGVRARDVTIEHTGTFLDDISSQNQTLLKILAKTGELMPRALDSHWISDEQHLMEHICLSTLRQIFYDEAAPAPLDIVDEQIVRIPLLCDDPFQTLTRLGFAITKAETNGLEIHHLLRLLYIAQLTKTTISLLSLDTDFGALKHARIKEAMDAINNHPPLKSEQIEAARRFACNIATLAHIPASHVQDTFDRIPPAVFAALLQTFTLPYLRRSLLLMVAHHGFILQNTQDDTKPEFDRLLDILRLPEFDEAFNLLPFEQEAVRGWCRHYFDYYRLSPSLNAETSVFKQNQAITLGLPSPHYLVSLPHRMDQLFDESSRRVCRKCNTLPEYPALCLICGTFVCARRYCCTENDRGECNTHMRSCSGDIGIFLVVKESFVLLLHEDGGSIMSAPYLDTHGEADLFLRRGTPQYLNPQRYEQIRQMWLSHSIPAYVRRKMESSYSYTRWESW